MITKFLESLEDPERRLLGPNIWFMKRTGLILPKNIYLKVAYIFSHTLLSIFVITQYIQIYIIRSDIDQVLDILKISCVSLICIIKTNTYLLWQDRWIQILEYVTEADNYERVNQDEIKGKIIDRYTKYCRRITYFAWGCVFVTGTSIVFMPTLMYLSSQNFRESVRNGTEQFAHIYNSWIPFDKNYFPGNCITVLWHSIISVIGGSLMAAYDSSIIVIMSFFGGKLEVLRERAKQMLGTFGNGISDDEASTTIRQLHHDHILLLKHSRLFDSLLSPIMFLYVIVCSLSICASAFQLTATTNVTRKLVTAETLIFTVAQVFVYCWQSNDVLFKSDQLMLGPYESEWWAANVKQRRSVLMLAEQFRIKHIFTAGPFTPLILSTFITILKGAYSYYTLLRK